MSRILQPTFFPLYTLYSLHSQELHKVPSLFLYLLH